MAQDRQNQTCVGIGLHGQDFATKGAFDLYFLSRMQIDRECAAIGVVPVVSQD